MGFDCYLKPLLSELIQWTQSSRETQNFTYTLTQSNIYQLSGWVSVISGCTLQQAKLWILELISDEVLRQHLNQLTSASKYAIGSDLNMGYGRRLGWYALVRALKPRTVVETGVDKGLGSCVLAAALLRNRSEGYPGFYLVLTSIPVLVGCSRVNTKILDRYFMAILSKVFSVLKVLLICLSMILIILRSMSNVNMPAFSLSSLPDQFFLATMLM